MYEYYMRLRSDWCKIKARIDSQYLTPNSAVDRTTRTSGLPHPPRPDWLLK